MKKYIIAASILAASVVGASAADLAARPAYTKAAPMAAMYDWSGFYIGLNGGGGWTRKCWDLTARGGVAVNPALAEGCHNGSGALVGGQVGYRWQMASWVFGLEGQGNWADLTGSNASLVVPATTNRSKVDAIGLVTGQVGYAMNNVLFYVKGGAMIVNDRYETVVTATSALVDRASETRVGAAVGAGLDFGLSPNMVLGVDYVHGFMGNADLGFTTAAGVPTRTVRVGQDVDMVTARFSYKFGR